ncbi:hypothetical protein PCASD_01557 [Puccinia coronata f. sp. avenae]|uniref:Uncharacterized protein n=1 Tax=Puccinia coronata f. sp. avenae TaxID=200324 RepID=A0A2N5VII4_9BASI|nr:hypothetical protein PCASD_01557 [Puccinia coronata f. sp. avenae]
MRVALRFEGSWSERGACLIGIIESATCSASRLKPARQAGCNLLGKQAATCSASRLQCNPLGEQVAGCLLGEQVAGCLLGKQVATCNLLTNQGTAGNLLAVACYLLGEQVTAGNLLGEQITAGNLLGEQVTAGNLLAEWVTACNLLAKQVEACSLLAKQVAGCYLLVEQVAGGSLLWEKVAGCYLLAKQVPAISFSVSMLHAATCLSTVPCSLIVVCNAQHWVVIKSQANIKEA